MTDQNRITRTDTDGSNPYVVSGLPAFVFSGTDEFQRSIRDQESRGQQEVLAVDGDGKRRVAVFYKAAYYDRCAFMRLETD